MSGPVTLQHTSTMRQVVEISIKLLVIATFLVWSFRILGPFINPITWAAVLAVAAYPVFVRVSGWLGGRRKLALGFLILLVLALVLVPAVMMTTSLLHSAQTLGESAADGTLQVPPPPDKVNYWPLVGGPLHETWQEASDNLEGFAAHYKPQIQKMSGKLLAGVAGAGASVLQLVLAILIAGALLLKADACVDGLTRFATRLAGPENAPTVLTLVTATVRSVAVGVLGVAFIQAVLAAIGMLFAGVPAVGIWALIVLLLAIMQLPPALVLLPIAIWVFGSADSQVTAWGFLVYSLLVSVSDSFLKPMLLGRGVDVPMPVILLGAIGGMLLSGILGLFVGAVVLALSYRLLTAWLEMETGDGTTAGTTESA